MLPTSSSSKGMTVRSLVNRKTHELGSLASPFRRSYSRRATWRGGPVAEAVPQHVSRRPEYGLLKGAFGTHPAQAKVHWEVHAGRYFGWSADDRATSLMRHQSLRPHPALSDRLGRPADKVSKEIKRQARFRLGGHRCASQRLPARQTALARAHGKAAGRKASSRSLPSWRNGSRLRRSSSHSARSAMQRA